MAVTIKERAQLESTIGTSLRLKPWESLEKIVISDTECKALIRTAEVTETVRQIRLKRIGKRLVVWSRTERSITTPSGVPIPLPATWNLVADETFWSDAEPEEVHIKGWFGYKSPAERAAQREYEQMCHRPGTKDMPLDNYTRVVSGQTTDKMERYW